MATKKGSSKTPGKALSVPKPASTALSTSAPSYIKEGREGVENIKLSEIKVPILKLGQPTTPEVVKGQITMGHFFNSVTKEDFGEAVEVILVLRAVGRQKTGKFKPGQQMDVQCYSPDGLTALEPKGKTAAGKATNNCLECVYSKWKDKKALKDDDDSTRPDCNEQGRYLVMVPGSALPMRLFLQSNGFQAHKSISTSLIVSQHQIYAYRFKFTSTLRENANGAFRVISAEPSGFVSEEDYKRGESMYKSMKASFSREVVAGGAE